MTGSLTELWKRVLADDSQAWEQLVRRYNSLILSVARSYGLAAADLDDCAQQTWYALYTGRETLRNPVGIPLWLIRVARRNARRIQSRKRSRALAEERFEQTESSSTPEALYVQAVEAARVQTALEMLDPRCRKLLSRLFLADEDCTYEELARDLGIAANSLGPIRSRCLERLRRILEKIDPELY